jgi:hypothetical protein
MRNEALSGEAHAHVMSTDFVRMVNRAARGRRCALEPLPQRRKVRETVVLVDPKRRVGF